MVILGNIVSYGLGLGATLCLAVAFTRIARRSRTSNSTRPRARSTPR
jgi:hypothetical protein